MKKLNLIHNPDFRIPLRSISSELSFKYGQWVLLGSGWIGSKSYNSDFGVKMYPNGGICQLMNKPLNKGFYGLKLKFVDVTVSNFEDFEVVIKGEFTGRLNLKGSDFIIHNVTNTNTYIAIYNGYISFEIGEIEITNKFQNEYLTLQKVYLIQDDVFFAEDIHDNQSYEDSLSYIGRFYSMHQVIGAYSDFTSVVFDVGCSFETIPAITLFVKDVVTNSYKTNKDIMVSNYHVDSSLSRVYMTITHPRYMDEFPPTLRIELTC